MTEATRPAHLPLPNQGTPPEVVEAALLNDLWARQSASPSGPAPNPPLAYDDGIVRVSGHFDPTQLGRVVHAAHGLAAAIEAIDPYAPATALPTWGLAYCEGERELAGEAPFTEAEKVALGASLAMEARHATAMQAAERSDVMDLLRTRPLDDVRAIWFVLDVLDVWAGETAHPLDLHRDPAGFGPEQSRRKNKIDTLRIFASLHAELRPEDVWDQLGDFALQLAADGHQLDSYRVFYGI